MDVFGAAVSRIAALLAYGQVKLAVAAAREASKTEEEAYLLYCAGKAYLALDQAGA